MANSKRMADALAKANRLREEAEERERQAEVKADSWLHSFADMPHTWLMLGGACAVLIGVGGVIGYWIGRVF